MDKKTKKLLIIMFPVIIFILICILIILYFTTDFLKSNEKLFLKYVSQNIDGIKIATDNKSEKEYTNFLKQNKYQSEANLKTVYKEQINTSEENKDNTINKLNVIVKSQSDYLNNYLYKNYKIKLDDNNLIESEYIKNNDIYGLRFPKKFNQFLAINNNDFNGAIEKLDLKQEQKELLPEKIEEIDINSILTFTDEEIENIKNRYVDALKKEIPKSNYSKQKNAMITIDNESLDTIAYSVKLTQEQANNMYIVLLETLKTDEEFLNKILQVEPIATTINLIKNDKEANNSNYLKEKCIKLIEEKVNNIKQNNIGTSEASLTVYQVRGNTIRTELTEEAREIIIDLKTQDNNSIEINFQNKIKNQDKENKKTIKLIKSSNEKESHFKVSFDSVVGDITESLELNREKIINENEANTKTEFKHKDKENNYLEVLLDKNINTVEELKKDIELDQSNCVIINDYEAEKVVNWKNQVLNYLKKTISDNKELVEDIKLVKVIKTLFNIQEEALVVPENNGGVSDIEKNKFNAKFEFYTGAEKKGEEVKKLLEEVKNNLNRAQLSYSNEGNSEATKKIESIKLDVTNDANKSEIADSIKELIQDNEEYKVEIEKNEVDVVSTLIITTKKR